MVEILPLKTRPGRIHATCILLGPRAVMLRGASGSGKSRLAGELIHTARTGGRFARLVADDQVEVSAVNSRLVVGAPDENAGLHEHTGVGIFEEPHEGRAVAGLVVDLVPIDHDSPRMPERAELETSIADVRLARLTLRADARGAAAIILETMTRLAQNRYRPDTLSTLRLESLLPRAPQIFNDRRGD